MPVGTTLRSWSATAASNNPKGTDIIGASADDELRQIQATIRQYLASQASSVVAAATTDLSTVDGHLVPISGNSTITGLGTEAAGIEYILNFSGSPVLIHSSALQLPGQATVNATVGDMCVAESLGSGNWKIWGYSRANGVLAVGAQAANAFLAGPASGAAALPTFRAPVGADGASLVLIATASASGSTSIDFTSGLTSTYDTYLLTGVDIIPATNATDLWFRVSEDGGVTFKAGAADYSYATFGSNDAAASGASGAAGANQILIRSALGNGGSADDTATFVLWLFNPAGTARRKIAQFRASVSISGSLSDQTGSGRYKGTSNAINAIRILMSSGNITSGNFALWGVRKT